MLVKRKTRVHFLHHREVMSRHTLSFQPVIVRSILIFGAVAILTDGFIDSGMTQETPKHSTQSLNADQQALASRLPEKPVEFDQLPVYFQDDLGVTYSRESTVLKLWAPSAAKVVVQLYPSGSSKPNQLLPMRRDTHGVWKVTLDGNLHGTEYLYHITHQEKSTGITLSYLVGDPYSTLCTANSHRSVISDLRQSDPADWMSDEFVKLERSTDAVIYELHLRDFTIDRDSGIESSKRGKYVGAIEAGSKNTSGLATGIDHLTELGITHVHLLPTQDYPFGDETEKADQYSWYDWGYGTKFFQTPEGSYATDPNGQARQKELKQLVKALHKRNIGVILDVVFNHTAATGSDPNSIFDQVAPYYFYRFNPDGSYCSASGCGNDLATERPMVRKFLVDTIRFWMNEYHIDGFRFDLMGLIDRKTMESIYLEAKKINPSALIYGEGWDMERNLPAEQMMTQSYVRGTGIAAFNDGIRDSIKGPVWDPEKPGYVQNGILHPERETFIKYLKAQSTANGIPVDSPTDAIQYCSAHDDHCLWDKIILSSPEDNRGDQVKMNHLAAGIILTSQGIPFIHAGDEFLRSKNGVKNSYNSNDPRVNPIRWSLKTEHIETYRFYEGLISLRRDHPAFRMHSREQVNQHFQVIDGLDKKTIAYKLVNSANGDPWSEILVVLNANRDKLKLKLEGTWNIVVNDKRAGTEVIQTCTDMIPIEPISILVAYLQHNSSPDHANEVKSKRRLHSERLDH